jgi:hypothetical protein
MTEEQKELFFDLLAKKAVYGLDEAEDNQLAEFDRDAVDAEFHSLEMSAAAIGLAGVGEVQQLPEHLRAQIMKNADRHFSETRTLVTDARTTGRTSGSSVLASDDEAPSRGWFGWLGWAAAAAACIALAVNLWITRGWQLQDVAVKPPETVERPADLTPLEKRDQLLSAATDIVKATWAGGNVKGITQLVGDIIWSDEKQAGYITVRGLPVNDQNRESYQLWIYDKSRDDEPIDGGVFNVSADGEVVIPVDARLRAQRPEKFAITIEKPGGVVVSKGERIAAVAVVETKQRSGA